MGLRLPLMAPPRPSHPPFSQKRLDVHAESRAKDGQNQPWHDVGEPVNTQVQYREGVDGHIRDYEQVKAPMAPIGDPDPLLSYVCPVDQQKRDGQAYVKARYPVIEWVVAREEVDVPTIVIHQGIDTNNVARGHLDVEEKIQGDCKEVDHEVIHRSEVG